MLGKSRQSRMPFESRPLLIDLFGNLHITPLTRNDLMMSVLGVKRQAYCCRCCNICLCKSSCRKSGPRYAHAGNTIDINAYANNVQMMYSFALHMRSLSIACRQMTGALVGCAHAPHPSYSSVVLQCGLQRHAPSSLSA